MLAEISIPTIGSPRAILCLVGIVYFIICACICYRGIQGWLTCLGLFILGLVLLAFLTPSKGEFGSEGIPGMTKQFKYNGEYVNSNDNYNPYVYEEREYRAIYYMHNPDNPNRISPWLWHPGCLWQSPLVVFLLGIFGYATGAGRRG